MGHYAQVGNWAFGVQIKSPWAGSPYVVGVDTAPGSIPFGSCEILLALSPTLIALSGQMSFLQETQSAPIPDQAALVGLQVYLQAVLLNPLLPVTNGIELTLVDVAP